MRCQGHVDTDVQRYDPDGQLVAALLFMDAWCPLKSEPKMHCYKNTQH